MQTLSGNEALWLVHIGNFSEASDFYVFEAIISFTLAIFHAIFKALQQSKIPTELQKWLARMGTAAIFFSLQK